ncbi:MAG: D-Ala-D-Ala carboxypeptidase family metallohydrolase [Limnobacter sp.]|uniref:D-Ala-D-Ala carboxypeptidase family metallohydrolase n=1 Tax=Limnobacter sp. TaxID=2003368 RepID=UPI00391AB0C8
MRLSKNFTLAEVIESQTGERNGIDNTPDASSLANLQFLFENLVQPIRDKFGPTIISSGYRCPKLNRAIGGALNSQHVLGQAADLKFVNVDKLEVARWILSSGLKFDQVILEAYDPADIRKGWLHVSLTRGINRMQVLTANFVLGKAQYSKGLPQ